MQTIQLNDSPDLYIEQTHFLAQSVHECVFVELIDLHMPVAAGK